MKYIISILILVTINYVSYSQISQIDEIVENKHISKAYFLNDSTLLYLKSDKKESVVVYNLRNREKQVILNGNKAVNSVILSYDKTLIATYSADKILRVYDLLKDSMIVSFKEESKWFPVMKFVPETNEIILFDRKLKKIKLYSLIENKLINTIELQAKSVVMDYLSSSEFISISISKSTESQIRLYEKNTFSLKHKIIIPEPGIFAPM